MKGNSYHDLMKASHPWMYETPGLIEMLGKFQILKENDKSQSCELEARRITQRVCVENKLKPRVCPLRLQHKCSMYKEHRSLMDGIVEAHRKLGENNQSRQGESAMGNRRKSESIANYIKERLAANVDRQTLEKDLDEKIKAGIFKTKQTSKSLVTWYTNFHKKRVKVEEPTVTA